MVTLLDVVAPDTKLFFLVNLGMANELFDILMPALTHHGHILIVPYILYMLWKGPKTGGSLISNPRFVLFLSRLRRPSWPRG